MARPQKAYKLREKATWTDFMKGYASGSSGVVKITQEPANRIHD